ncbi:DUF255 domain-containing protein [Thiomicrorhabdus heinhorstiae]|uniref:Thioredoxin domain-containing protein n=1 Tax=Thiomicrorhabdus heinhorstiae TaxID=2748010 RepID=A0ABS0C132_9GAMM|nr:DUF255 domain-containing protein [Thiomicrorhabdus heinhorstiae]MBF6058979.1 thioredoxin domain-containing protein [Thiomicrorhabdus heinhorstiae]
MLFKSDYMTAEKRYGNLSKIVFTIGLLFLFSPAQAQVAWQDYNRASFEQAEQENKLLLLDLKANWCHWCHVMDQKTYADPQVIEELNEHYVAMKVDHDARPDLAERYRDWGWPATIILTPDGKELHKQAGFIQAERFLTLLKNMRSNPQTYDNTLSFPNKLAESAEIVPKLEKELQRRHLSSFDPKYGSLKLAQKFIDPEAVLWDLKLASDGDSKARQRVILTLNNALALIDPVFGGAYQYSTHGDWQHPHYEKIMAVQANYMLVYSTAYKQLNNPEYLQAAQSIASYLNRFLSDANGGFYTSQDADLKQGLKAHEYFQSDLSSRLEQGIPKIDKHQYSAENGLAIDAYLHLYDASGQKQYLQRAEQALRWVEQSRRLGRGGYRHGRIDYAGPYLADTLNMGIAWLHLYQIEQKPATLKKAQMAEEFIQRYFRHPQGGLVSAVDNGTPITPLPQLDQNIRAVRFLLHLYRLKPSASTLELAEHILRYLNTAEIALSRLTDAGILSINEDYRQIIKKNFVSE